jgi:hypothetical protein
VILARCAAPKRSRPAARHVACESLTVGGQCFSSPACVISVFRTYLGTFGLFQQREPPGLEQGYDGVDLGLRCGVVRVRPQDGGGVVQAVQLVCGFCHAAARRADRVHGERWPARADAAGGDRFGYPPGAAAERFRVHETAGGFP